MQVVPSVKDTNCMLDKRIHEVQYQMIANYMSLKWRLIFEITPKRHFDDDLNSCY